MLDKIVANGGRSEARARHHERHMQSLVVEKLLSAGMADAVVGHKHHNRVLGVAVGFEAGKNLPDKGVGQPHRIEVGRPVFEQYRVAGVVRRQGDSVGVDLGAKLLRHPVGKLAGRFPRAPAVLAARELNLGEEGLAGGPLTPVCSVIHLAVPLEVVVGLAEFPAALVGPPGDRGVVAGLLEEFRNRSHVLGKVNLQRAATTAVVVGPDRGLIHPRDKRGAVG